MVIIGSSPSRKGANGEFRTSTRGRVRLLRKQGYSLRKTAKEMSYIYGVKIAPSRVRRIEKSKVKIAYYIH